MKRLIEGIIETARLAHENKEMDFSEIETVIREEFQGRLIENESAVSKSAFSDGLGAAALAKRFHETYEKLAPQFNYKTREESKGAWDEVPEANKKLMIATCAEILKQGI